MKHDKMSTISNNEKKYLPGITDLLVDNTKAGKTSSETRAVFRNMTEHEFVGKVSIYGINMVSRMLTAFVIGLSNNKICISVKQRKKQ